MLKLTTIRREGTLTVLGRNLAVRVLIEKTERAEIHTSPAESGNQDCILSDTAACTSAPAELEGYGAAAIPSITI